ncbi:MAG TPA: DUF2617 family protein [Micromonospora sp.]
MLVTLDTGYADTTAADLSFTTTAPEQPALLVLDLGDLAAGGAAAGGATVSVATASVARDAPSGLHLRLRLLGASHQVVLDTPAGRLIETVACLPGQRPELPATVDDRATGYRFTARVLRLSPAELSARTAGLRAELAADPYALVGVFPGSRDAITGLRAARSALPGGEPTVRWQTWHAYPQTGELVETETAVMVR